MNMYKDHEQINVSDNKSGGFLMFFFDRFQLHNTILLKENVKLKASFY